MFSNKSSNESLNINSNQMFNLSNQQNNQTISHVKANQRFTETRFFISCFSVQLMMNIFSFLLIIISIVITICRNWIAPNPDKCFNEKEKKLSKSFEFSFQYGGDLNYFFKVIYGQFVYQQHGAIGKFHFSPSFKLEDCKA